MHLVVMLYAVLIHELKHDPALEWAHTRQVVWAEICKSPLLHL